MSTQKPAAIYSKIGAAKPDGGRVTIAFETNMLGGGRLIATRRGGWRVEQSTYLSNTELDLDEAARTLTWNGSAYTVDDVEAARSLVRAISDRRSGLPTSASSGIRHSPAALARRRASSVGNGLAVLAWIYGTLSVVGAVVIALLEDDFGDHPYVAVGLAAGLSSVMLATALLAFGNFVVAWALTADEQAAKS